MLGDRFDAVVERLTGAEVIVRSKHHHLSRDLAVPVAADSERFYLWGEVDDELDLIVTFRALVLDGDAVARLLSDTDRIIRIADAHVQCWTASPVRRHLGTVGASLARIDVDPIGVAARGACRQRDIEGDFVAR